MGSILFKRWILLLGFLALTACQDVAEKFVPICEIISVEDTADFSGLDYGVRLNFVVFNSGADGSVKLTVALQTSEGDYLKKRNVLISARGSREISFLFSEPSVNATDMQYRYECTPL